MPSSNFHNAGINFGIIPRIAAFKLKVKAANKLHLVIVTMTVL